MTYENILLEKKNAIAYVTVNRPKVLNALDMATMEELRGAFHGSKPRAIHHRGHRDHRGRLSGCRRRSFGRLKGSSTPPASGLPLWWRGLNAFITERLLLSACDGLLRSGAMPKDIEIARVPGAFEIPSAARTLALTGKYDAIICIGCLLRGDTAHYDEIPKKLPKILTAISKQATLFLGDAPY